MDAPAPRMPTVPEADARQRLCPLMLTETVGDKNCRGSQCMAWRWVQQPIGGGSHRSELGYCGLAGKVEFW